jgi:hypothetical protein
MVPQQVHYQMSWLTVFEHSWTCPFAICPARIATPSDAGGYPLLAISLFATFNLLAIGYRPLAIFFAL